MPFSTEPIYVQLMPWSRHGLYVLSWRIAETLPPAEDGEYMDSADLAHAPESGDAAPLHVYRPPPTYPAELTLRARVDMDTVHGLPYEPVRHEGTGVDDEERMYTSRLLPIDDAVLQLAPVGQDWIVWKGWEAICLRDRMERAASTAEAGPDT